MATLRRYEKDGLALRAELERLGLNQTEFATAIEMGTRHVRKLCAGECKVPRLVWMAVEYMKTQRSNP